MATSDFDRTDTDAVIELTRAAAVQVRTVPGADHLQDVVLPPGHQRELIDLERYQPAPRRTRAVVRLHTATSLGDYVNRHKDAAATTVYANAEFGTVCAVLNDSALGAPGWADHRAVLELKPTDAWRRWADKDNLLMGQHEFAEHVEAGLAEIVNPPSADMLEMAQSFEATKGVAFKSVHRLADGQRALLYEETVEAKAGQKGSIEIPKEFELAIAPYEGSDAALVAARLRYRINGTSLVIGYVLVRPADILRSALLEAVAAIEEATGLSAFWGSPPERP